MLFTEFRYVVFFVLVFAVYWRLKGNRARKAWLLAGSYVFYGAWDWRFCSLILFSTLVDYTAGGMLGRERPPVGRRFWLGLSVAVNLGLLGFYKYFDFFVESGQTLFAVFGLHLPVRTLGLILPVGISFYTFQTLSYTIDIYRGTLRPIRSFLDFAFFVSFFPQLVAGPIVRAIDFLPQLDEPRQLRRVNFRACLTLFLIGYVKKACISDNLALFADRYFAGPEMFDVATTWTAVIYYAIQIYCDFSGYSDMAIASAGLLGYTLCLNFNWPLLSTNIGDFWRRWHVSLSSWLRDYLYIPLGGNRGAPLFVYRNLMTTLVLCGLWHGAGWNYVIFGALHAVAVIGRAEWLARLPARWWIRRAAAFLGLPLTFAFFCGSCIIFRPNGLGPTLTALKAYFLFDAQGNQSLDMRFLLIFPALAVAHWVAWRGWLVKPWMRAPRWVVYTLLGAGAALALQWTAPGYRPFIYFQF